MAHGLSATQRMRRDDLTALYCLHQDADFTEKALVAPLLVGLDKVSKTLQLKGYYFQKWAPFFKKRATISKGGISNVEALYF